MVFERRHLLLCFLLSSQRIALCAESYFASCTASSAHYYCCNVHTLQMSSIRRRVASAAARSLAVSTTMFGPQALLLLLLLMLQSFTPVCGMIHNLSVQNDARRVFQIESFGFREGGFMNLTVSGYSVRTAFNLLARYRERLALLSSERNGLVVSSRHSC